MTVRVLTLLAAAPLMAQGIRAGRGMVKITPQVGIPMAGYYSVRLATGTHDDLYTKALVLESGGVKVALVACDLVVVERSIAVSARSQIEKLTGIPASHVMISSTHSHTGPLLRPRFLEAMPAPAAEIARKYMAALPGRIAEAVRAADSSLAPARISAAVGREESLAFNRRYLMKDGTVRTNPGKLNPEIVQPSGPVDPEVSVVYIESSDSKPIATYVNYALHLDTVGGMDFSADYPHTLAKLLGAIKGPEMLTLFTIGAAGDINHVDVKSKVPQKGHSEAGRIGTVLAGEVLKSYARLEPLPEGALRTRSDVVKLPVPAVDDATVTKARTVAASFGQKQAPFLEHVNAFKVLDIADLKGTPLEAEVQVITLGDRVAWVGFRGEIFTELGMAIKRASPYPITIVTALANGTISYVPTRKAFGQGGYEVVSARCAPGCGETLADTAIQLLIAASRAK